MSVATIFKGLHRTVHAALFSSWWPSEAGIWLNEVIVKLVCFKCAQALMPHHRLARAAQVSTINFMIPG